MVNFRLLLLRLQWDIIMEPSYDGDEQYAGALIEMAASI